MKLDRIVPFSDKVIDRSAQIQKVMVGKKFIPPFPLKDKSTFLGIEVEVERVFNERGILAIDDAFFLWNNIADGSLRNNGREFVSIPVRGDDVSFAINQLHLKLTKDKTCIGHEFTDRTSVHVHVNARDMEIEQIKNLIITYLVVEPLLYSFVGGDRAKNIFCVPVVESHLNRLVSNLLAANDKYFVNNLRNWYKYTGFNLLPLLKYGTIEFRHMVGTINEEFLAKWLNMLLSLKMYSQTVPFEKNKEQILSLNTNSEYYNYLREVLGDDVDLGEFMNVENSLEKTSIFIKDAFTLKDNTYFSLLPEEDKKSLGVTSKGIPFMDVAVKFGLIKFLDVETEIKEKLKQIDKYLQQIDDCKKAIVEYQTIIKNKSRNNLAAYRTAITQQQDSVKIYEFKIEELKAQIESLRNPSVVSYPDYFNLGVINALDNGMNINNEEPRIRINRNFEAVQVAPLPDGWVVDEPDEDVDNEDEEDF
jgi:hypothetical protein